jgi:hypothetical protein
MNPATRNAHDDSDELMGRFLRDAGDPHVEPRTEHAAQLRSLLLERLGPTRFGSRWKTRLLVGSGLAAAAIALSMHSLGRSAIAWAQVAEALQKRPWLHSTILGPDGKTMSEGWFRTNEDVIVYKTSAGVDFHDEKNKVYLRFVPSDGVIYRVPRPVEPITSELNLYRQLLNPNGPSKFPYPGAELVSQTRREVKEGGKTWLEIELTVREAANHLVIIRCRVEPETKLLRSWVTTDHGKTYTGSIDYPERGPADLHDLGAPRTAKVVDRIPSGEVDRVLEALRIGRNLFDDYCAIEVEEILKPTYYEPKLNVVRVWRKGRKWRAERLCPRGANWPPPADADAAWWKTHQDDYAFVPTNLCDSREYWSYYLKDDWNPGTPIPQPSKVGPSKVSGPADDPAMSWPRLLPERIGHPTVWPSDRDREFQLDRQPSHGPRGTILLKLHDTGPQHPEYPDMLRLWIKPEENSLALRTETRVHTAADSTKIAFMMTEALESTARSPKGYWYPTRLRETTSDGVHERVVTYYLDFEAALPDELFRPVE